MRSDRPALRPRLAVALLALLAVVAAACGGSSGSSSDSGGGSSNGSSDSGTPQRGGKVVYALEGKTTSFCMPRAQLAASGIMIAQSVYDTLTMLTAQGTYVPFLAKSVTSSSTFDEWTITLRDGVKFHDGTALDAAAVAQNIEAWRTAPLLQYLFSDVASVAVTSPTTVVVKTKAPWVSFPAALFAGGRAGVAAPSQLDDPATCDRNMIGTGPFKLEQFEPSTGDVTVVRNPDYWRQGLPYLDGISFKIQARPDQRISGLQGGQFDLIMGSGGRNIADVKALGSAAKLYEEPPGFRNVSHILLNVSKPPFDDLRARKALAMALDRRALDAIENGGTGQLADQIYDTKVLGHVADSGFPTYNPKDAKKLVDAYKADHDGQFAFDLQSTFESDIQAQASEVKREAAKVGITVNLPAPVDQALLINQAIRGAIPAFLWRNFPGSDPDTASTWWRSGALVNFNHANDPQLDAAFAAGRATDDESARRVQYEKVSKRISSQVYNVWIYNTSWFVATKPKVHDVLGPKLPDASGAPGTQSGPNIWGGYHSLAGLWVDQ